MRKQTKLADKQLEQQAREAGIEPLAKGEVMRMEKGANERDSAYWAEMRPIPLTDEEPTTTR